MMRSGMKMTSKRPSANATNVRSSLSTVLNHDHENDDSCSSSFSFWVGERADVAAKAFEEPRANAEIDAVAVELGIGGNVNAATERGSIAMNLGARLERDRATDRRRITLDHRVFGNGDRPADGD